MLSIVLPVTNMAYLTARGSCQFFSTSSLKSSLRSLGNLIPVPTTVRMVSTPPRTTAFTVPNIRAVSPLSNAPSSFEEPTNMEFTEATRPRISSGVFSWRMVWRITTLIPSSTPLKNRAITEIQNMVDTPNTIMHTPNPKMAARSFIPAFRFRGK